MKELFSDPRFNRGSHLHEHRLDAMENDIPMLGTSDVECPTEVARLSSRFDQSRIREGRGAAITFIQRGEAALNVNVPRLTFQATRLWRMLSLTTVMTVPSASLSCWPPRTTSFQPSARRSRRVSSSSSMAMITRSSGAVVSVCRTARICQEERAVHRRRRLSRRSPARGSAQWTQRGWLERMRQPKTSEVREGIACSRSRLCVPAPKETRLQTQRLHAGIRAATKRATSDQLGQACPAMGAKDTPHNSVAVSAG